MKKKFSSLLLSLALVLATTPIPTFAETLEHIEGGVVYSLDTESDTATVTGVDDNTFPEDGAVEILPSVTDGDVTYTVCYIGGEAFKSNTDLTSIIIPNSVIQILGYAFDGCTRLTSVTIPESVSDIGHGVFKDCSKLTSIAIPDSVTSLGSYQLFWGCTALTSVTLPTSLASIGECMFSGCRALTSVNIPNAVTAIGAFAFEGCNMLTSVTLPEGVTTIGQAAFRTCSGLTSFVVPNSVTDLSAGVFQGCKGLTDVTLGASVSDIQANVFEDCSRLTSIIIPDSVHSIGQYAFAGCTRLASVTIPNSVTKIDPFAFADCSSLESLALPDYLETLYATAFKGCTALTSVTIVSSNGSFTSDNGLLLSKNGSALIFCPRDATSVAVPASVTSIQSFAFDGCSSLTSVTFPDSLSFLGKCAFRNCSSLTSLHIPASLSTVSGSVALVCEGCSSLSSLTVADDNSSYSSVDNLLLSKDGSELLFCPDGLSSVTIPASVSDIDDNAFSLDSACSSLTVADSNSTYSSVDNLLLSKDGSTLILCPGGLSTASVPDSVSVVSPTAFFYSSSLTSVKLPALVTNINVMHFFLCQNLTSLTVADSNSTYSSVDNLLLSKDGSRLVFCPGGLSSVTIPDTVTTIDQMACLFGPNLTSLTIPCNFDLKLFGWNDSDGFTGESGVVPITGYSADFKPTNETTCKYLCLTDLNKEPELKDVGITLSHGWDEGEVSTPATCTEKGEKKFTCKHNVEHTKTEEIPALGHKRGAFVTVTPATCDAAGSGFFNCSRCSFPEYVTISALGHDWDEGKVTKDPTCTEAGEKTFTCQHDCGKTKTEEVAIDPTAHDLSDMVVSEPTAEKLGVVHRVCSRCDCDIFSHYTLKDGTSPTMYPDGSPISSTVRTPTAASTFDLNGQEIEILLQDPLDVFGSRATFDLGLTVRHIDLPATFDGDVEIEHSHSYDIIPTVNGVEKSGQLSNKVRLLYKIPQGWDKHDLEVFLAQAGEDGEFSETTEWIGDDEYLVIWTDHFSPYIFVDKLNPGEIAELEKLQNSEGSDNNANTPQDTSGNGHTSGNHSIKTGDASGEILLLSTLAMIVTGLYLGLFLKKKSF